jgi:hypothetical protein
MNHRFFAAALALLLPCLAQAQSCLPGGFAATAQSQIDNFTATHPNCTEIEGSVTIQGNDIVNLGGLGPIQRIGGDLNIVNNGALTDLSGLDNLTSVGGVIRIQNNAALAALDGLDKLKSARGDFFYIASNGLLSSLAALSSLDSVAGIFQIWNCPALADLAGLENLTAVGQDFAIFNNNGLTSLDGLESLSYIGDALRIYENPALTALTALAHPIAIQGALVINNNPALSECGVRPVCDYLQAPASFVAISNNQIGCNSAAEVTTACMSTSTAMLLRPQLRAFPNPTSGLVEIAGVEGALRRVQARDAMGKIVFSEHQPTPAVDIDALPAGVYYLEITTDQGLEVLRIVKH